MKQFSGQSKVGYNLTCPISISQVVSRLLWCNLEGFPEEVTETGREGWEDLSRWRGGARVSMPHKETEGTGSHEKGNTVPPNPRWEATFSFKAPRAPKRTQTGPQDHCHSLSLVPLLRGQCRVPVTTEAQNHQCLLLLQCRPHRGGNKGNRERTILGRQKS